MTNMLYMAESRGVNLEQRHLDWIEENSLNFSDWVRKQIDQELEGEE